VLPLEDYVAAVLGGEMPVAFPMEALKAQAVAARTYALQRKIEALGQPVHLGSSVLAQVYGGVNRENPRTRAATAATAGQILTFQLAPIEAYFHASCEGNTETGLDALGVTSPTSRASPASAGRGPRPAGRSTSTRARSSGPSVAAMESSGSPARTGTGRVRRLELGGRSLGGVEFRQRLGYDRVRSLAFDVSPTPGGGALLTGRGLGHGAGLSQWGAKEMADSAQDYRAILAHFYPGSELQTLY
jgi:stage II sporulation protein D